MARCELVRCTPESVGLSSRKLLEMVKKLESCGTEMHGLMVTRHGKVVLEGWWAPHTKDTVHICHSFGKSYVATAVGAACTDGLMTVEDRVADIFRDDLKAFGVADEGNLSRLKVKHVLSMTNGMKVHALAGKDLVRNYLTTHVDFEPGSVFMYNTAGSCMLGEMVRRVTGKSVYDYMKDRVFDPIGIDTEHFHWMTFEGGLHAAPGVASTTENNLRLGMLYLQNGQWDGKQIIDAEWIKAATVKQIDNHLCGYGYQLWMNSPPESFRFCGGHGQDCIMSRPQDIAVSITQAGSEPHDTDATLSIINQSLLLDSLPDVLPEDEAAYAELCAYMQTRRVGTCASRPERAFAKDWEGRYNVVEGKFHLHPELRPFGNINVNADFYTIPDPDVRTIDIRRVEEGFELVFNDDLTILARLDGQWIPHFAQSAMPAYNQSCACAQVDFDELIIHHWFCQTCFKTRMVLKREDGVVRAQIRKERLHDDWPYIELSAVLEKV